jgi:hypothetical protein
MDADRIRNALPRKAGLGQSIAEHLTICRFSVGNEYGDLPEGSPAGSCYWGLMLMAKDRGSSIMAEFCATDDDVVFMIQQMQTVKDYISDPSNGFENPKP